MSRKVKMTMPKTEKEQQKSEVGRLSEVYPKVMKIVINMRYAQTGVLDPLSRMINFYPDSLATFKVTCLCSDCVEGVFDFNKIIRSMVRTRKTVSKGVIGCENCSSPECSDVAYSVNIKYTQMK